MNAIRDRASSPHPQPSEVRLDAKHDRAAHNPHSDDTTTIRRRYDQLMSRLRRIATDPLQRVPQNDYLPALHRGALTLAKRVYHDIRQSAAEGSDTPSDQISPTALLKVGESLLDRHDRQQQLLAELKELSLELCGLIAEMPRERPPKYTKIVELTDCIIEQSASKTTIEDILPQPGLPITEILAGELPTSHTRVYVEAVTAAQLIAWTPNAHKAMKTREQLQHLMIAALLRDVGCLVIDPHVIHNHEQLKETQLGLYRRHPRLSAAMIGRMRRPPISVARLVARHHERLNGTGFPAQLSDLQFNEALRLLTAATDYVAMYRSTAPVNHFVTHPESRRREMAQEFSSRAMRGQLDHDWVERILGGSERTTELAKPTKTDTPPQHSTQLSTQHQLHSDHVRLAAPHHQTQLPNDGASVPQPQSLVSQPH
ncbi:Cyclic di-GMP phosphodiesterase response regulator RpfG [Symmachiella macrocystis]|uniref:Cyclic di-GMP phosphodiesterase response regulator RpfG n=1 Tax=Symmachiella macrocystis TaxID=2527985 RepID=A0A5C6B686_9PLAN|nr:HD domain-containing phosphohydrolase [Symmachiella macrocystis]TWU07021.1 Cyclic di-GMP phosphodiesterase response regulator RpfG [Symmachiella macrocystis]